MVRKPRGYVRSQKAPRGRTHWTDPRWLVVPYLIARWQLHSIFDDLERQVSYFFWQIYLLKPATIALKIGHVAFQGLDTTLLFTWLSMTLYHHISLTFFPGKHWKGWNSWKGWKLKSNEWFCPQHTLGRWDPKKLPLSHPQRKKFRNIN